MAALHRRSLLALGSAASFAPAAGQAQIKIPDKGISIIVGFPSSGSTDTIARWIAPKLERRIGRHVTVQNKPGAAGAMAGEAAKKATPDGTVLAFIPSTTLVSRLASKTFPFDPLVDLAPITTVGSYQTGLAVSPTIGVKTLPEYLEWVKAGDETRHKIGSTASDAFVEVLSKLFKEATGVTLELVPYRGSAALVNDLQGGAVPAAVSAITSLLEHHRGGRLRILMTTGAKRQAVAKNIPTARELGYPQLEMNEWFAFFTTAGTPPETLETWNDQFRFVLADGEMKAQMVQLGLEVETCTIEEARALVLAHRKDWEQRLQAIGIKPIE
jgi:tripartite-type tricarboxylate transporter receptor subunit TctC